MEDLASEDNSTGLRGTVGSLDFKSDLQFFASKKSRAEVLNVTGNGVFVDVNCEAFRVHRERFLPRVRRVPRSDPPTVEVRGYVSPMDIDLNATPDGLYKGFEAKQLKIWSVTTLGLQIFGIIPFNYR